MVEDSTSAADAGVAAVLDLSQQARLSAGFGEGYDRAARAIRREYVEFIGSIAEQTADNLDWWLEAPASRHPILSRLFHDCTALVALDQLLQEGAPFACVQVDTPELHAAVRAVVARSGRPLPVRYRPGAFRRWLKRRRQALSPLRSAVRLFLEWLVVRASRIGAGAAQPQDGELILIDTFLLPGYLDRERYYPGLFEAMPEEVRSRARFVPQFHDFSLYGLWSAARRTRALPERYLCKEDYLGLRELLWCVGHRRRARRLRLSSCRFRGLDMSGFIDAEIRRGSGMRSAVRGLINYRFAGGLKRAGVRVGHAIDWFENDPLDRGWNAGFGRFFPDATTTGYQGFYPALQAARPSVAEGRAGLLPRVIAVMGECFRNEVSEFEPGCKVVTAPAFRYRHLAGEPVGVSGDDCSTILVALPYDASAAEFILEIVGAIAERCTDLHFVVKAHPARRLAELSGARTRAARSLQEVSGSLESWYPKVAAMITGGAATTVVESAAYGVPVIVAVPHGRGYEVSIPATLPDDVVRVCQDRAALELELARIGRTGSDSGARRRLLAGQVRRRCFTPVNPETVARFLGVGPRGGQQPLPAT